MKKKSTYALILLAALLIFAGCEKKIPDAPVIPLEDFFRNPEKDAFSISPDGKQIAFLQPWKNRLNIFVQKLDGGKVKRITNSEERDIHYFYWANDNTILFLQDTNGDEKYQLISIKYDGSEQKNVTPFPNSNVSVIDPLYDKENEVLLSLNLRDQKIADVYRLNIATGKLDLVLKNPGKITRWITDYDGNIRIGITTDGINSGIIYRSAGAKDFKPIFITNFKESLEPLFFSADNKFVYALSNLGRDKIAAVKINPETAEEVEVLYENPEVDVFRILRSRKRKKVVGVSFLSFKREVRIFDDETNKIYKSIFQKLPDYEVYIHDFDKDEKRLIVRTFSDRSLGAYYLYDVDKNELKKLADVSPWLKESELAPMKPISFRARDGLTIHGYLTVPNGLKPQNLPVVIFPHGGPWSRNLWGYNREIQFFANRGYAVLQVNYRGSLGYGKKFWEAGFKEWGGKMQDDITDGVRWLIRQNIADSTKIGIYGFSYGGYAALMGLIKTPDLYACAVDYSGTTNLFSFLNIIPPQWEPYRKMLYEMVGDPVKDSLLLANNSPLFNADKITKPILIAQGENDPRVNLDDTELFIEELEKRGMKVDYFYKPDEGHSFEKEE
ncbi:MAG: S9 family peptidase, partial [Chlorobi bacterium]|nr:S9 family peptidase [Chlorobiota bacterium]